ncbi:hypothetical protein D3C84_759800 [compost metagenome]
MSCEVIRILTQCSERWDDLREVNLNELLAITNLRQVVHIQNNFVVDVVPHEVRCAERRRILDDVRQHGVVVDDQRLFIVLQSLQLAHRAKRAVTAAVLSDHTLNVAEGLHRVANWIDVTGSVVDVQKRLTSQKDLIRRLRTYGHTVNVCVMQDRHLRQTELGNRINLRSVNLRLPPQTELSDINVLI